MEQPVPISTLSMIYDDAVGEVYRYVRGRCRSNELAEDITSATLVQAALSEQRRTIDAVTIPWLITIARNRLIDHWRREAVAARSLTMLDGGADGHDDPWDAVLDQQRAHQVLDELAPMHRAVLVLRYLDDLSVGEVAASIGKSVRATESLLARARRAFRDTYETDDRRGHD